MSINHRGYGQDTKAHDTYSCPMIHANTLICSTFQKRFKINNRNTTPKRCKCWVINSRWQTISNIYKMDAKYCTQIIYKNHTTIHTKYSKIKINTYCLGSALTL